MMFATVSRSSGMIAFLANARLFNGLVICV